MKNMIDVLIEKIKETKNPTVMGLDPRYEMLPKCVTDKYPNCSVLICVPKALERLPFGLR